MFTAGIYKKHFYKKDYQYESFLPSPINGKFDWRDKAITVSLEEAVKLLGELNSYSNFIPDIDFFIKMHIVKEATTSSKIEGTKTEIEEAVLPADQILPEKRNDWEEVHNYIKAMWFAIEKLKELPLCLRLIKGAHKTLLSGVRGQEKQPGKIRKTQNWIGGSSLKDALFIPPHPEEVPRLLSDLEKFWHNNSLGLPILIKTALTHYQFETIHPFLDGNGRIGRLLITLQFISNDVLSLPTLYISDFFEKNRGAYYNSLNMVRSSNDVEQWIKFFLVAVTETSKKGIATFKRIITLREKYANITDTLGRRTPLAKKLLLYMFSNPIITVNQASEELGVVYNTASSLIKALLDKKILTKTSAAQRNQFFELKEYLDLFKE